MDQMIRVRIYDENRVVHILLPLYLEFWILHIRVDPNSLMVAFDMVTVMVLLGRKTIVIGVEGRIVADIEGRIVIGVEERIVDGIVAEDHSKMGQGWGGVRWGSCVMVGRMTVGCKIAVAWKLDHSMMDKQVDKKPCGTPYPGASTRRENRQKAGAGEQDTLRTTH